MSQNKAPNGGTDSPTAKKHPCLDCLYCQHCSEARCSLCRMGIKNRKISIEEQIALYNAINDQFLSS